MSPSPTLRRLLTNFADFSDQLLPQRALRPYQLAPATAILEAVLAGGGEQFAVVFSRQAGKDEMLAQLLSFLLLRHARIGGQIVAAAPTLQPQAAISQHRLVECLRANPLTSSFTRVRGNVVSVGKATVTFASASPRANSRGLTANLLLVANEAQDIDPAVWDAVFDPMAASTNATTLFMGTVWSQQGLLARQMRYLREREGVDGQRLWLVPWQDVAAVLPAYGTRVRTRMAQLGANHPFIRTEYCLEELDGDDTLFPPARIAHLSGTHERLDGPSPDGRYALLVDVGGEDPARTIGEDEPDFDGRRDSTAVTVVEVDLLARADGRPVYRVVHRLLWTGLAQPVIHERLVGLIDRWRANWVVVDATGLGAGLTSFLEATYRRTVSRAGAVQIVPFVFTATSKSQLGWDLVSLIDAERLHDHLAGLPPDPVAVEFQRQLRAIVTQIMPGPGRLLRWAVPPGAGHDDLVMSLALVAHLDALDLSPRIARGA
ncbi:MAG TPA: hypothetical protein VEW66_09200 [Thermomicrobiales bacterium]|nr:hypothetical protein [Thermomicrobiales bacterium]